MLSCLHNQPPEWVGIDAAVACCACGGGVLVPKGDTEAEKKLKTQGLVLPPSPFVYRRPPLRVIEEISKFC